MVQVDQVLSHVACNSVTILAHGRGVQPDGTLTNYVKFRVSETLQVATLLADSGKEVEIVWTGGASRVQIAAGTTMLRSEAEAMHSFAMNCDGYKPNRFTHKTEPDSITTVENMANSSPLITGGTLVIITDDDHYRWRRVQIIAGLMFPHKRNIVFVRIKSDGFSLKRRVVQFASTIALVCTMIGVRPGNRWAIMRRQRMLERLFRVR